MNEHGLFDIPGWSLWLPTYNSKTVWTDLVTCWVAMLMDGGWSLKVFFDPVPKYPARFANIFLRAVYVWAFELVDKLTLLQFAVFIFGCHKECFYVFVPLKWTCIPLLLHILYISPIPCMYGITMEMFLLLLFLLFGGLSMDLGSWLLLFLHSYLCCSWLSAHEWKWHA